MNKPRFATRAALCAMTMAMAGAALAADAYPGDKPVRIIAAFSTGSATDNSARILGQELSRDLGGNFIIENRPGAQGVIGTDFALRQPADGYTLTITSSSLNSINPGLVKDLRYDAVKDFTHISRLTTMPMLLLVRGDGDVSSVKDLVQKAKSKTLNFGYGSPGGQVAGAAFNSIAGVKATGIPYKSQPPALTDLAGGQVDYVLGDLSVAMPLIRSNKIRALAISTPQRLKDLPDVPTFAETGYSAFDLVVWVGVGGPAGMPADVVAKLNQSINKALARPEVQQKFELMGMTVAPNTPEQQLGFVQDQLATWSKRMKEAGIQPE
ncbi:Bug family tripartite tricarboxylate transporter substrate binding protein [Bordetella hinzii]|nr:tripartite tricarboxylate transporter substrate binding protein [Bordetella hinzii]AKQ53973.1 Tripartite tricarboxylate transporter family receptor [Bordetella hinzii]AKQ58463.1 Tripartite tricarboxylate transporter family receptor [Bordetella hinzii]KCB22545.1 tripartite tricarboxylate transporter family receptor [Bordetella hinzii OH87 BAL007II]KCB33719.1 tripartite tricarboxylate transporter family receptor [Bordetella hinzii L60]KCB41916.1 tripartite tricarboxylate transporter family re